MLVLVLVLLCSFAVCFTSIFALPPSPLASICICEHGLYDDSGDGLVGRLQFLLADSMEDLTRTMATLGNKWQLRAHQIKLLEGDAASISIAGAAGGKFQTAQRI